MGRVRLYILHYSHTGIRLSASFLGVCRIFRVIRVLAKILEHIVLVNTENRPHVFPFFVSDGQEVTDSAAGKLHTILGCSL